MSRVEDFHTQRASMEWGGRDHGDPLPEWERRDWIKQDWAEAPTEFGRKADVQAREALGSGRCSRKRQP